MRHPLVIVLLSVAALISSAAPALAADTLDQQQTSYDGFSGNSTVCVAQTITAGLSGHLDRVSIYVRKLTDHPIMPLEIRDVLPSGEPGSTVLASTSVSGADIGTSFGWVDFDFGTPALVQSGIAYAIVAPPLGPMGPDPNPWGFEWGGASQTPSVDPYPDGRFYSANDCSGPFGTQSDDLAFQTFVDTEGAYQPDGWIRINFGTWAGQNLYDSSGDGQARSGSADPGNWVLFRIAIQNDGLFPDRFVVGASGPATSGYRIRYFRKTFEITDRVNAGTFQTRWLDPGQRTTIEAWVKPRASAAPGSSVTRLVTITSVDGPTEVDAVRFTVARR